MMLQPLGSSNVGACSVVGVAGACSAVGSPWLAQPSERERPRGLLSRRREREREEKERNKGEIVIGFMGGRPTRERRADGRGADGRERERNWRGFGRAPMVVFQQQWRKKRREREKEKSGGERKKTLGRERKWREREK